MAGKAGLAPLAPHFVFVQNLPPLASRFEDQFDRFAHRPLSAARFGHVVRLALYLVAGIGHGNPESYAMHHDDIRQIVRLMEVVREELGPRGEFAIDLHWRFDTRDAIDLAKALEKVRPMWIEDPVPPENPDAMAFVRRQSPVPICTGENLYTRQGFLRLIELQGCDGVHIDIPKSGGLLESKRISDLADNYYIWTAAHNPASPVGTIASAHAAASMRNFRIHELAKYIDWWPDLVIHEGPIWENGYLTIQDKPGYGIELNPDVARAHLAPGETWWG